MARILIVDDDEKIRMLMTRYLGRVGYTVIEAETGKRGIEQYESLQPDLIVTDILMPEMDGMEFLTALREKNPDIPIIVISGGMRDIPVNFLKLAKEMGAQYSLKKPFSMDVLHTAISELLSNRTAP